MPPAAEKGTEAKSSPFPQRRLAKPSESALVFGHFEPPQIIAHHGWHSHSYCRGEILFRHLALPFRRQQNFGNPICQFRRVSGAVKTDCHFFIERHVDEVVNVGAHDRNTIFASLVRRTTRACGGVIWHSNDACCPE